MATADMPALGEVIAGRYRIHAVIGQGGMGTVFKAEHVNMGKTVALKMLAMRRANEDELRRFRLEAKLASQLSHPNIIAITDFDVDNNRPFIIMDYLRGQSLERALRDNQVLAIDRFEHIMMQACRALAYAHKSGLIHRDIKPSNMMLTERGGEKDVLIIVDFGLVDVMTADTAVGENSAGIALGSPLYMSPEQCRAEKVDHRSDVYAMGCVMYRCLTGVVPFPGDNVREVFEKHVLEPPLSFDDVNPSNKVPPSLERVVMKAMSKEPADRQQDMLSLADDIKNALHKRRLIDEVSSADLSHSASLLNTTQIRKFKGDSSSKLIIAVVLAVVAVLFVVLYVTVGRSLLP